MTLNNYKQEEIAAERKEIEEAVKKFLKEGGEITVCEPNARTPDLPSGQWGRKGKKKSES